MEHVRGMLHFYQKIRKDEKENEREKNEIFHDG